MLKRFLHWLVNTLIRCPFMFLWCWFNGVSDSWLRFVFGELVQLELLEWTEVAPSAWIMSDGATLLMKDSMVNRLWSINQNGAGKMYVHEMGDEHFVEHHDLANVKTRWHEVYRTNHLLLDPSFYNLLKFIVREGDYAVQKSEAGEVSLVPASADCGEVDA